MISNEEMRQAFDRIARTEDGAAIYLYFQKTLCAVSATDLHERALPRLEGRRSFAAELMGLMAEGIEASAAGRSNPTVTFALAGARRVASPGGAGRRVTADTFVPGYDTPDPGAGA